MLVWQQPHLATQFLQPWVVSLRMQIDLIDSMFFVSITSKFFELLQLQMKLPHVMKLLYYSIFFYQALVSRQRRLNSQQNLQRGLPVLVAKSKLSMSQRKKAKLKSRRWSPFTTLLRVLRKNSPALPTIASLSATPLPHLRPTSTLFAVPSLEPT